MTKHARPAALGGGELLRTKLVLAASIVTLSLLLLGGCGTALNGKSSASQEKWDALESVRLPKAADAFAASATTGNAAYKIGPQDVLDISVFKAPDLTRTVQVADSGTINLPLVGEVHAAEKTAQEIERDLARRLGARHLQSPQVTVYVKEFNSQRVTVEGAVKKPGVYPLRGGTTLMQALAMAQGLDATSDSGNVVIFRQVEGKRFAAKFDIAQIRAGKSEDPVMRQGDLVVANSSAMRAAWENLLQVLPSSSAFVRAF